jgi:penicillin-binding protein-related factor A (putative recombinase)
MSGNRSKQKGTAGQDAAEMALRLYGVDMVEEIATPVILRPVPGRPGAFYVTYKQAVSGDIRGVIDNGRSVLAEVKNYDEDTLPYSILKTHQHAALQTHHEFGGLSLLVWVGFGEVKIYEYPIEGFVKGTSLRWTI